VDLAPHMLRAPHSIGRPVIADNSARGAGAPSRLSSPVAEHLAQLRLPPRSAEAPTPLTAHRVLLHCAAPTRLCNRSPSHMLLEPEGHRTIFPEARTPVLSASAEYALVQKYPWARYAVVRVLPMMSIS
jgi:hypothetical protein